MTGSALRRHVALALGMLAVGLGALRLLPEARLAEHPAIHDEALYIFESWTYDALFIEHLRLEGLRLLYEEAHPAAGSVDTR